MPNDNRIWDGSLSAVAMDSDTNPSDLPNNFDWIAVNLIFREGKRRTRPPFTEINLILGPGQDESVMTEFKTGNFQGAYPYQTINYSAQDGIAVSVSGSIFFISIINNNGYLYKLIDGNDPGMLHTWFVQAEDWLYIQNGYQNPIAWNGDLTGRPTNTQALGLNSPSTIGTGFTTASRERTAAVATIVLASNHNLSLGDEVQVSGLGGTGYNGIWTITAIPAANSFSYANAGANEGTTADAAGTATKYIGEIRVTWTDNSTIEAGFELQWRIGTGAWTTIALGPNINSYDFSPATSTISYSFRVRTLFDNDIASPWSNMATTMSTNTVITASSPDTIFRLNPAAQKMPVGTIMEYAYGRVWVSDKNNNIYASDIIYGAGFTDTANTQNFTEQTYWNEGGSFTPPARFGQITGMKVMPSLNINDRGQGELVVSCENGFFTINGSVDRELWLDTNIQKVALFGRGNKSPWSTIGVNNEMLFRSDDGWSLYSNSQLDFNQRLSFRKLSKEVNRWVNNDTPWLRQFASAMFFDNRLIATVSPYTVQNANEDEGLHRPHRAMVVLDLDQTTMTAPDSQLSFRWNGLWTGPQPTQLLTAQIRGDQRGFCFSFDADGVNRLYELHVSGTNDYVNSASKKIKGYFITKRYNFAQSEQTNAFLRKAINGGELWVSDVPEQIKIGVQYRPDSYPCYGELMPDTEFGCDFCSGSNEEESCTPIFSQNRFKRFKFTTPDSNECQIGEEIPLPQGAEFQLLVEMEGSMTVDRLRISCDLKGNIDIPFGECPGEEQECREIDCCPMKELDYYKIIE